MDDQSPKIDWKAKFAKDQILTIPNILSFFRIALIPFIVWLYLIDQPYWALALVVLSGLTDIVDGYVARKFNMVTDFGKAIDPIADKVTQGVIMIALVVNFPLMWLPIGIMVVKEALAFTLRLIAFKKTQIVESAVWHGKLTTVVLYLIIVLHMVWPGIEQFPTVSAICIFAASGLMVMSCLLYTIDTIRLMSMPDKK